MNNVIQTKSYAFAIRIVNAYKFLIDSKKEYVLTKQVLRSGTAIGALVAEQGSCAVKVRPLCKQNEYCLKGGQ